MLKRNIMVKPKDKTKGQSTVEYIILVAVVIGAVLIFLKGTFQNVYLNSLEIGSNGMATMAGRLNGSRPPPPELDDSESR